jgi:hypothetical protein
MLLKEVYEKLHLLQSVLHGDVGVVQTFRNYVDVVFVYLAIVCGLKGLQTNFG